MKKVPPRTPLQKLFNKYLGQSMFRSLDLDMLFSVGMKNVQIFGLHILCFIVLSAFRCRLKCRCYREREGRHRMRRGTAEGK